MNSFWSLGVLRLISCFASLHCIRACKLRSGIGSFVLLFLSIYLFFLLLFSLFPFYHFLCSCLHQASSSSSSSFLFAYLHFVPMFTMDFSLSLRVLCTLLCFCAASLCLFFQHPIIGRRRVIKIAFSLYDITSSLGESELIRYDAAGH